MLTLIVARGVGGAIGKDGGIPWHAPEDLALFAREIAPAGTSWAPGTTGAAGRPSVSPSIRQYAFLVDKTRLTPQVHVGKQTLNIAVPAGTPWVPPTPRTSEATWLPGADAVEVPLVRLAWARSGDKGDTSNIGVIARRPELLPLLRAQLTPERVAQWLAHLVQGPVTRFEVPGVHAFGSACSGMIRGLSISTPASLNDQPRPMSSTASSCTFDRPHSVNFERVQRLASVIDGELVRRGPITSVRWFRVATTCERWNASWRMRDVMSRSTRS